MDAIEALETRCSNGKLIEPEPDADSLRHAWQAAARAPDHGMLRPWRVHLVRGDARLRLGELMAGVAKRKRPQTSDEELAKIRDKALRAPLIIVVSAHLVEHPKVPKVEQLLAAGSAAHAILVALHARGFAAIWRTGDPAYDDGIKRAFDLSDSDAIVGFLYAGTAKQPPPTMERPLPEDFVSSWHG